MLKRRLLLIDDTPDNLEVLTVLLRDKYDVFGYGSCTDALAALQSIKPDLLLLDVRMFPMDGVDFLKHVRTVHAFSEVPAMAITALAGDADRQTILAAGFQAVLTKPIIDLSTLDESIE